MICEKNTLTFFLDEITTYLHSIFKLRTGTKQQQKNSPLDTLFENINVVDRVNAKYQCPINNKICIGNLKIKLVDHENVSLFFKSDLK